MANITADAVGALRAAVSGVVSQPGEASYDDAVNIWNSAGWPCPAASSVALE
jgi:hypothetical protein